MDIETEVELEGLVHCPYCDRDFEATLKGWTSIEVEAEDLRDEVKMDMLEQNAPHRHDWDWEGNCSLCGKNRDEHYKQLTENIPERRQDNCLNCKIVKNL